MGSTLAGGHKQRVLLARALYRRPKILLMDEGTVHSDPRLEASVNAAISAMGITRIVIAHREAAISAADRVVEMRNGTSGEPAATSSKTPVPAPAMSSPRAIGRAWRKSMSPLQSPRPAGAEPRTNVPARE
jgi:ATP-binding cassette subfamily B protein RaxB